MNEDTGFTQPSLLRRALLPRYKSAPGPHGHVLLGSTRAIQRDPLRFGLAMTQQYGDIVRLYPPAWVFGRKAIAGDEIGGYFIPANSQIVLSPYVMHRHPAFGEEPEAFDPERFTHERSASRPRYTYFPFGGGPRLCIGSNFALMEMQFILATIAQRYKLRLVPGLPVEPEALLSLRPRYGLPMTLHRT